MAATFFEPVRIVSGLQNIAVVSQSIEKRRGHFGVSEDLHPFSEGEVGGDNQRGLFVEFADQMEEQGASRLREGQVAQFVEDDEVQALQGSDEAAALGAHRCWQP